MKSDALFYQLFQTAPQIFFELINATPNCAYHFTSVTLKTAEKRLDGLLEPTLSGEPIYFVEVQAKKDEGIYWLSCWKLRSILIKILTDKALPGQPW